MSTVQLGTLAEEFLDQFDDVLSKSELEPKRLEELTVDDARRTLSEMREGALPIARDLEAIILRFGRPAYFVRDDEVDTANTPSSSKTIDKAVNEAAKVVKSTVPSVGRINLRNHSSSWVGTGWLVADDVVVTNRHVALTFAHRSGETFELGESFSGARTRAYLDTRHEHQSSASHSFRMREVLWIEPRKKGHHDVAFLRVDREGEDGEQLPKPLSLMTKEEVLEMQAQDRWAAVVGYPAYSIHNSRHDQQRIFQGVFNVKRLQPGLITAVRPDGGIEHDATTLGGNSGSSIIDLRTGRVVALHWGGLEHETNNAVSAPIVAGLLAEHVR